MALIDKILITRNDTDGNILATPVVYELCPQAQDLKETAKFDEKGCLTSSVKKKIYTGMDIAGGVTFDLTHQNAAIIMPLVYGEADTTVDATAAVWVLDTVYAVGDIVNHSNGTNSLTVIRIKGDMKSGAVEPTALTGNSSETRKDNNVTWQITPKLLMQTIEYKDISPLVSIEYSITDGANTFYKRFNGVEFGKLPISVSGDGGVPSIQIDLGAMEAEDSEEAGWAGNLAAIAGATIVTLGKDIYSGDAKQQHALLDGSEMCLDTAEITIDKGITSKGCVGGNKKLLRDTKMDGKLALDFTIDEYNRYRAQERFPLEITLNSGAGSYVEYTFPSIEPFPADPDLNTKTEVLLSPDFAALDDSFGVVASVEYVFPQFENTTGTVVGGF